MPEALTESYCERCGTRYEFAAPSQLGKLRKTRGVISGLRNYIMSQDALSDAIGDAMRSEEETLASAQLDAFHQSFNFCIQCRQYACVNCWNEPAGRCRTCVPIPGTDDLIERFEATFHAQHPAPAEAEMELDDLSRRLGAEAWPSEDLTIAAESNGHAAVEWPAQALTDQYPALETSEAPPMAEEQPAEELAAQLPPAGPPQVELPQAERTAPPVEPVAAESAPSEADLWAQVPETPATAEPMLPALEGQGPITRWEDDAVFELDAEPMPEPEPVREAPVVQPEPVAAFEAEPSPQPEPEPIAEAPAAEPLPEPDARPRPVAPQITPISETILRVPQPPQAPEAPQAPAYEEERVAARADDPALAARRAKLELLGLGDPGEGPVTESKRNVLAYRSSGASVHPAELAALGAGESPTAAPTGTFWEASAREVAGAMAAIGVQSCGECGLSLSATARFCRRCGTRQARSA
jgi:hypothetical protein